ncbi:hypothetical protein BGW38_003388 [Lunasporangiospora selenospora]|uniref:Uncharacterized protein n=1 Tax=Lunasporangiospora selenospora TaxID=979761 RepID=A0A9P6FRJ9_9FUNG|nr:hypothetical protein BGW38_003388 [Lunasporangiospora selenospora]
MIARIAFPILTLWTTLAIVASMANAAPVPDSFANYDYNKEVYALLNTDTEATRSKAKLEAKLEAARANDPGRKALKYVEDKFKAGALLNDIKAFTFDAYKAVVKDNLVDKAAFYKIVTRQYKFSAIEKTYLVLAALYKVAN